MTINSSQQIGIGTTSPSYQLHVNGTFGTTERQHCIIQSAAATSTGVGGVTTTNFITLPDSGVYFLMCSAAADSLGSHRIQNISTHTRIWMVIASAVTGTNCIMYNLGSSSTTNFDLVPSGRLTINLTVAAGNSTVYRAWHQKIF